MSYPPHSIVRLETRPTKLEVSARRRGLSGTLVCDRFRFKWKPLPAVFTIICDTTDAISFRSSQTVLDHVETRLNMERKGKELHIISSNAVSAILLYCTRCQFPGCYGSTGFLVATRFVLRRLSAAQCQN